MGYRVSSKYMLDGWRDEWMLDEWIDKNWMKRQRGESFFRFRKIYYLYGLNGFVLLFRFSLQFVILVFREFECFFFIFLCKDILDIFVCLGKFFFKFWDSWDDVWFRVFYKEVLDNGGLVFGKLRIFVKKIVSQRVDRIFKCMNVLNN